MAGKVETICEQKIVPLVNQIGYEVIEIDYSKKIDGMNLTFTIFSKNGVSIDDCEAVHKLISNALDQINPTDDAQYTLNVESEGLDRPVKSKADFERHKGEEYEVRLYAPVNKKKSYVGFLIDYDDKLVILKVQGEEISFLKEQVALIAPVLKF